MNKIETNPVSRRTFVQTTAAATAAMMWPGGVHVAGSDIIRVGVIGCGGRGTGAAVDVMRSSDGVEIVALGDLMPDRLAQCRDTIAKTIGSNAALQAKYKVTDDKCFTGFDAFQKVLATDVNYVILAAAPGFRPGHLAAAVAAGKHTFTEKPVAVDSAGIRSVLETHKLAVQKDLGIGAGTQRRHQAEYLPAITRIHDGAIGDVMSGQVFWNQGGLWNQARQASWSDAEWQIRNWLYFTWLSGDHIVEQHVHNIDVANWVLNAHPIKATGVGGRQWRTDPKYGHIFDHFAIDFEYPSGARVMSMCRQIDRTAGRIAEDFIGSKGRAFLADRAPSRIVGPNPWTLDKPATPFISPYIQEHTDLIASIRSGKPYNELQQVAESTLTAILGREAAYTGQEITWEQILKADMDLTPPNLALGPLAVPAVPMPGLTKIDRKFADT
jgi:myo-inositol 2-dehydrogenase / D-chiro-inositol 1-dehydrogenase